MKRNAKVLGQRKMLHIIQASNWLIFNYTEKKVFHSSNNYFVTLRVSPLKCLPGLTVGVLILYGILSAILYTVC